jgi:hypothetical protein
MIPMSPFAQKALPPRILLAVGVIAIVISNFVADQPTLQAGLRIAGGVTALVGVAWFLAVIRASRRS